MNATGRNLGASVLALLLALTAAADAQQPVPFVPHVIPVQGLLSDPQGAPIDGEFDVDVALYRVPNGGTALVTETHAGVSFDGGQFTVMLGSESLDFDFADLGESPELWLEVHVDGEQLTPRLRIGSVPYAAVAETCSDARTVGGLAPSAFATEDHSHGWDDIQGVPDDFADGTDDDALAALECADGDLPRFSGNAWTCGTVSASDLDGGTLSPALYSAYADLQAESRLGVTSDTSILTRGSADTRYMSASLVPVYTTLVAASAQTNMTSLSGRFCALSAISATAPGGCAISGTGPFTLTTTGGNTQASSCTAVCF